MIPFKTFYNNQKKPIVSTDDFSIILAGDEYPSKSKIMIEDNFLDNSLMSLYKKETAKYGIDFVPYKNYLEAELEGRDVDLFQFLVKVKHMMVEEIKDKYPKLSYTEFKKKIQDDIRNSDDSVATPSDTSSEEPPSKKKPKKEKSEPKEEAPVEEPPIIEEPAEKPEL